METLDQNNEINIIELVIDFLNETFELYTSAKESTFEFKINDCILDIYNKPEYHPTIHHHINIELIDSIDFIDGGGFGCIIIIIKGKDIYTRMMEIQTQGPYTNPTQIWLDTFDLSSEDKEKIIANINKAFFHLKELCQNK